MKISVPADYKKTNGGDDPVRYLTGVAAKEHIDLLDHCETFLKGRVKERIFVSHPYTTTTDPRLDVMRKVLASYGVAMAVFPDSWYHENTIRIELYRANIHEGVASDRVCRVLKHKKKPVVVVR